MTQQLTQIFLDSIPENLRLKKEARWTVFRITGEIKNGKYVKIPCNCDGSPPGEHITKGQFYQVKETIEKNEAGKYYPAYWIEEKDNLLFIDVDTPNTDEWPTINTYTELSVSGGYHALCWYNGTLSKNSIERVGKTKLEVYKLHYILMTGNIVSNKKDINDLTDSVKELLGSVGDPSGTKPAYTAPSKPVVGDRHTDTIRLVGSLVSKNFSYDEILALMRERNSKSFVEPWTESELLTEVKNAYSHAVSNEAKKGKKKPSNDEKKANTVDYISIAKTFNDSGLFLTFNDTIFRYKDGFFSEDKGQLNVEVTGQLLERGIDATDRVTVASTQILHYVKYNHLYSEYPFNLEKNLIPVKNGVIRIDYDTGDVTLLPHDPKFRFNYSINVTYKPDADTTKVKAYLDTLGVDTQLLLQIPAHAILSMMGGVYKKAYFLKGDPDSGKSTFINLITKRLFGDNVCSCVSLQSLLYDRFRLAELDGKIMNAYADLSDAKINDIGLFKALTGGDAVTVERKHRDPYRMANKAVLVFSANKYPVISAGDDAFWQRWNAISFNRKFKVDPTFEEREFTDEFVSGLLLLVVGRVKEIVKDKAILTTASVENEWLCDSSSAYFFFMQELERCQGAVLIKQDVYKRYVEFCQSGDYEVQGMRMLTDTIKKHGGVDAYPTVKGTRQHCYQGFKFKGTEPVYPDVDRKESGNLDNNQKTLSNNDIENNTTVQDVQDIFHISRVSNLDHKSCDDVYNNNIVTGLEPAHPAQDCNQNPIESYMGLTRPQLEKILEQHRGKPPRPEEFRAAWKKAGEWI